MKVNQIATMLNDIIVTEEIGKGVTVTPEGGSATTYPIAKEDLSNIVDIGKTILDFTGANKDNFNNFVEGMIDRIGKVQFVDRVYSGSAPNIVYDAFEYGSILQKVRAEVPDFQENSSWKLADIAADAKANSKVPGVANYDELDPYVLSIPKADAKFYNKMVTFEAPITIAEMQLKSAFQSAEALSSFVAMIENRINIKMTLSTDALIMRTINNLAGLKIGLKENVVNLLSLYNATVTTPITAADALHSTEFLKFATKTMALYKDYVKKAGTLYNHSGYITFTPEDRLKFVVLSEFAKDMETYLYADTFNEEFVKLSGFSQVPSWQSVGTKVDGDGVRDTIYVTATDGTNEYTVRQEGLVGIMFDRDACAVCNENYRTTSAYNPRGEYVNFFHKYDSRFMNDIEENVIVFIVADYQSAGSLPDTKPTDWDTVYAIANSPYYIYKNGSYVQLSASDKTTASGFDWDDYKGLPVYTK